MAALGSAALFAGFASCLYAVFAALRGRKGDRRWVDSARRGIYAFAGLMVLAVLCLEVSFLRDDFSLALVAGHSSEATPLGFKLTAMWSSQAGSLLLWAFVLSIATSIVLRITRNRHREIVPYATAILAGLGAFFTGLMLFGVLSPEAESFPFAAVVGPVPADGVGLNPLLRHPAMAIHPPMLYSGYVFFSIPFAFAIGALITRRVDASWIRSTRRFALVAWTLLGTGILLGSFWSYNELGWGGYWGWDPVENASLMPWLIGTAFIHSVMVQEKRGMLRVWNVSLIVATFALCLLGTFLVRSGVIESIHAFGVSKVGGPLLALIAVVVIGSAALIVSRLDSLRSERRIDSLISREAVFLINNLLLVALCVVVFWGTFFPLISELVTGDERTVGPPFFNSVITPLAILLVLFTGIGPMLAWRRVTASRAWSLLAWPLAVGALAGVAAVLLAGAGSSPAALAMFCFGAFTIAALSQELIRSTAAHRRLAGGSWLGSASSVIGRNRRRYGGYTVHAGIVILFVAVAASSSFQTSRDVRLDVGQSASVDDLDVTYESATARVDSDEQKVVFGARLVIERDGELVTTMDPSREYFSVTSADTSGLIRSFFEGEATSEVGREGSPTRDIWAAMRPDLAVYDDQIDKLDSQLDKIASAGAGASGEEAAQLEAVLAQLQGAGVAKIVDEYQANPPPADFRVNVNPFVIWLWIGGAIAVLGGAIAAWPPGSGGRRAVSEAYAARVARDLGRA